VVAEYEVSTEATTASRSRLRRLPNLSRFEHSLGRRKRFVQLFRGGDNSATCTLVMPFANKAGTALTL
jgi:hypothetical protein